MAHVHGLVFSHEDSDTTLSPIGVSIMTDSVQAVKDFFSKALSITESMASWPAAYLESGAFCPHASERPINEAGG